MLPAGLAWNDPWLLGGVAALLVLLLAVLAWRRRRQQRTPRARLARVSGGLLADFLVPDGEGGEIHVEIAALTGRGILIIDLKQVAGHVFGSNAMQDWTVISDRRRFTFSNPQPPLYDRVAAVRRLITDVPVTGCVAFLAGARFSKGLPADVVLFDDLVAALRDEGAGGLEAYRAAWDRLREEAVTAQLGHLMRDA